MKRTLLALALALLLTLTAVSALACGPKLATYAATVVDRCFSRNATITIDQPDGERIYITISAADAKRLRDDLNAFYLIRGGK